MRPWGHCKVGFYSAPTPQMLRRREHKLLSFFSGLQGNVGFGLRRVDGSWRGVCGARQGQRHSAAGPGCSSKVDGGAALAQCHHEEALEFLHHPSVLVKNVIV